MEQREVASKIENAQKAAQEALTAQLDAIIAEMDSFKVPLPNYEAFPHEKICDRNVENIKDMLKEARISITNSTHE